MHLPSVELDLPRILTLLERRDRLPGCAVDLAAILPDLATRPMPPAGWLIDNALLRLRNPQSLQFPGPLTLVNCTLLVSPDVRRAFSRCHFDRLILRHCTVQGDLRLHLCTFDQRLVIESMHCDGALEFTDCTFADPPDLDSSRLLDKVVFSGINGAWLQRRAWRFNRCQFAGRLELESPGGPTDFHFNECSFERSCSAMVKLANNAGGMNPLTCQLEDCVVAGRLSVAQNRAGQDEQAHNVGVRMSLVGSAISGEVDLSGLPLRALDLERAAFSGGQLGLTHRALSSKLPPRRWYQFWRWLPADRCGVLQREQLIAGAVPFTLPPANTSEVEDMKAVAKQYGELRNSFSGVANASRQEDFCHYKLRDYQRRARVGRVDGTRIIACSGLCVNAAILSCVFVVLGCSPLLPVETLLVTAGTIGLLGGKRTVHFMGIIIDWIFFKWAFGYGVYLHRILISAFVVICLFAAIYGAVSALWPASGKIMGVEGCSILLRQSAATNSAANKPKYQSVSWLTAIGRLLYFSIVTFTTLGYGDYYPVGALQAVASVEVCSGAIMVALVTVILARKFLR